MASNLRTIRDRIAKACDLAGRDPASVTLVAASKGHPAHKIQEAYDIGLRVFGESRLQEAIPKIEILPRDIEWHFIGALQSNKAKKAAGYFHVIHTLETTGQLRELAKSGRTIDALIEVNIAEEPQKSGIPVNLLDAYHKQVLNCSAVQFRGLMTIGPDNCDPEQMRSYFRKLAKIGSELGGNWLSMGMSDDFEVAIQEGSTHIRIGTALFGQRDY